MTKIVIPDASVILKWVLPSADEHDQENALKIRQLFLEEQIILKVPSLWFYEVGNTLGRNFPEQAKQLMEALILFGLQEVSWTIPWLDQCLAISQRYQVSFYDAAYHSLALLEKGIFVTADAQYVKKTKTIGAIKNIKDWV